MQEGNCPSCQCSCNATLFTVISGSFRKHLHQISRLKQKLEQQHIKVLSPTGDNAINPDDEFIVLDSDPISHPKLLQDSVFAKMRRSTFLVVANVDGYLGRAAVLEIGYAIAHGITIYTLEPVEDPNISPYCRPLHEIFPDIVSTLKNKDEISNRCIPTSSQIQEVFAVKKLNTFNNNS